MKCPSCGADLELEFKLTKRGDWRKDPATPGQLHKLKKIGVKHNPNITKGAASALIDFYEKERFKG